MADTQPMELPVDRKLTRRELDWLAANLHDREWRLNNLYKVRHNERLLTFRMRPFQRLLLMDNHPRKLVVKERGEGTSTAGLIDALDRSLFRKNHLAAITSERDEDACRLFRIKLETAYDNLPIELREDDEFKRTKSENGEYAFKNGSGLFCSTQSRSQRVGYLMASEFGPLCAHSKRKSEEFVGGSLNSVLEGGTVLIESTALGRDGYYYRWADAAIKAWRLGRPLTRLEWKLFFAKWYEHPDYTYNERETAMVTIPEFLLGYFARLDCDYKIKLTPGQKAWYTMKVLESAEERGEDKGAGWSMMKGNYPSYPEEAFDVAVTGAYYAEQFDKIMLEQRICKVPHTPGIPVDTWWDIGINDPTIIIYTQDVGRAVHVIDYYENSDGGLDHAIKEIVTKAQTRGFMYGKHYAPHDINHREWTGGGDTRWDVAERMGLKFVQNIARPSNTQAVEDAIDATRRLLSSCYFDSTTCDRSGGLVEHLRNYSRQWSDAKGWVGKPKHDKHSHAADAFRLLGMYHTWDSQRRTTPIIAFNDQFAATAAYA